MNNQKSIIGWNYTAKGVVAFDLETKTQANLGKRPYKIIKAPYVSEYRSRMGFNPFSPLEAMFVNVLDERSGRTYQVVYEPANLLEHTNSDKPKTDQSGEPVDFATRAKQITEEFKVMFDPAGGGEFRTSAVLHSLRFRTTETIKHRRASGLSAVKAVGCRRLSLRRVPRIPKSSKS